MATPPSSASSAARPGEPSASAARPGSWSGRMRARALIHRFGAEGVEAEAAAAAADGGQQAARGGASQEEDGAGGGFLEHFQDRIGGVAVEVFGAVDDDDAPTALGRGEAQETGDVAGAIDDDLGALPLALVVPFACHGE